MERALTRTQSQQMETIANENQPVAMTIETIQQSMNKSGKKSTITSFKCKRKFKISFLKHLMGVVVVDVVDDERFNTLKDS